MNMYGVSMVPWFLGEAGKCEVLEGRGGLYEGLYGTIVKKSV